MSERLSITPLGPYIGAQITGADCVSSQRYCNCLRISKGRL
ncbi:MAG: hypothetical protein ACLUB4_08040, partial [Escherichia coli]